MKEYRNPECYSEQFWNPLTWQALKMAMRSRKIETSKTIIHHIGTLDFLTRFTSSALYS